MLRRRVGFNFHGAGVVFSQEILHRIEIMLTHVSKAPAVVIPVAPERTVHPMRMIWLVGRGAKPHVVVELWWDGLRREIWLSGPCAQLPCEPRNPADGRLQWP